MKRACIAGAMSLTIFLSACTSTDEEAVNNIEETVRGGSAGQSSGVTDRSSNGAEMTRITREQAADLCRKDGVGSLRPEEMLGAILVVDTAEETDTGWKIDGEFSIGRSGETVPMTCTTFDGINGNLPHAVASVFDFRGIDLEGLEP